MYLLFNRKEYELCSISGCGRPGLVWFGDEEYYCECLFHYGVWNFIKFLIEKLIRRGHDGLSSSELKTLDKSQ